MGCPLPDGADDYHHDHARNTMLYISAACTGVTFIISTSLIVQHLRRYRCSKEQRQIIRICFSPFVFAVVSFLEILSYKIAPYIDPIGDLYEAFGLCALFLLYLQYAAPGGTFDEETFQQVKSAEEGNVFNADWPRITWIFVFQYPVTEFIALLILEITEAADDYCVQSLAPKYGHFWETVISSIGVGACFIAILRFYAHMKNRIRVRRGLAKLVCFKLIVGLRFLQSTIFSILLDHNVIKPSDSLTYNDILYGIENVLTCAEMAAISGLFWYAYSSTEYSSKAKPSDRPIPIHRAILDAINPWDLFQGIGRVFTIFLHLKRTGGFADWGAARKQAKAEKKAGKLQQNRGQGRYQTVDGMEPLSRPSAVAQGGSQFEDTAYHAQAGNGQPLYQPPSGSPPTYEDPSSYLMADPRRARSPSPSGRGWNGQRYDRSPSPGGEFAEPQSMA